MKKLATAVFAVLLAASVSPSVAASAAPNDEVRPLMCKPHWAKCRFSSECCSKSCSGTCNG